MFTRITFLEFCLVAGVGLYFIKQALTKKQPAPFPPGPKGLPFVGNIADVPSIKPWLTFARWGQKYGDITHVEVLGRHIVILNNIKVAIEMLEKKSFSYSDRPVLPMGGELVGWKDSLALLPYGDRFREYRKLSARVIGSRATMETYHPIQKLETHRFLQRVLGKPAELAQHVRHTAGAIILRTTYGYQVKDNKDPFIDLADRGVEQFSMSTATGAFMVDMIPSLAYLPDWFPGAGFKIKAREWRATLKDVVEKPYQFVKDQMAAGTAPKSFVSDLLEGRVLSEEEEHNIKWTSASLYGGGADTIVSAIYSLFLALTLFPDVQKKAQAEIDAVVGSDRLPNFADRDSLPYVDAVAKEVLRWNVVTPLALPHCVSEDDTHNGYYIPKGALVIPNVWHMLYNPQTYPEPNEFKPERFLAKDGKEPEVDPRTVCFGFGRRICPGMHMADAFVWISVAMSLAVFNISKVIENGVEITPEVDLSSGTICHPKPFKCSIKPRSAKASELIQQDPVY